MKSGVGSCSLSSKKASLRLVNYFPNCRGSGLLLIIQFVVLTLLSQVKDAVGGGGGGGGRVAGSLVRCKTCMREIIPFVLSYFGQGARSCMKS